MLLAYALGGAVLSFPVFERGSLDVTTVPDQETEEVRVVSTTTIAFVGDIMLARFVDTLARREGHQYPFSGVAPLLNETYVVGNFEGCVSEIRDATPGTMRFPVHPVFVPVLVENGFTHLSLANNHAFDCGAAALEETRALFEGQGIAAFGHPTAIATSSVTEITTKNGTTISLIGLHTLYRPVTTSDLEQSFALASTSDVQIVFVHWGNEYELTHSEAQEQLAQRLVAFGADLIIGHHPHVVQDVDIIDGVPVFYSLGNFIFDQYFSLPVQQGLLAVVTVEPTRSIRLVPVTSVGRRSSPRPMDDQERNDFLVALAARSHPALQAMIVEGSLVDWGTLASSSEIAIMSR